MLPPLADLLLQWLDHDKEHPDFEEVDSHDWAISYKDYAIKDTTYKHLPSGRFVCINESRSGSYYSDYHYDEPTICEVRPVTKTVTSYEVVPAEADGFALPACGWDGNAQPCESCQ